MPWMVWIYILFYPESCGMTRLRSKVGRFNFQVQLSNIIRELCWAAAVGKTGRPVVVKGRD